MRKTFLRLLIGVLSVLLTASVFGACGTVSAKNFAVNVAQCENGTLTADKPTATFGAIAPKVVVKRTKTLACTRLQRIKQHDYKKGTIYIGTSMVSLSFLKSLV